MDGLLRRAVGAGTIILRFLPSYDVPPLGETA